MITVRGVAWIGLGGGPCPLSRFVPRPSFLTGVVNRFSHACFPKEIIYSGRCEATGYFCTVYAYIRCFVREQR